MNKWVYPEGVLFLFLFFWRGVNDEQITIEIVDVFKKGKFDVLGIYATNKTKRPNLT